MHRDGTRPLTRMRSVLVCVYGLVMQVWYLLGLCYLLLDMPKKCREALLEAKQQLEQTRNLDTTLLNQINSLLERRSMTEEEKATYWNPRWWINDSGECHELLSLLDLVLVHESVWEIHVGFAGFSDTLGRLCTLYIFFERRRRAYCEAVVVVAQWMRPRLETGRSSACSRRGMAPPNQPSAVETVPIWYCYYYCCYKYSFWQRLSFELYV